VKRAFDIVVALTLLVLVMPVLIVAAAGVVVASPGPIFYRAQRMGRGGRPFEMLKLRTMHLAVGGSVITSRSDPRIFPLGGLLRKLKIDEFPQFWNVLWGDMAIVGPRPEDPKIVLDHYTPWMKETLRIRPGITSIGSIYYYAEGEALIGDDDPERCYVEKALPSKLAVERAYMDRATFLTDLWWVCMTSVSVVMMALGRPLRLSDRDLHGADRWHPVRLRPDYAGARS
jgi:lipopolysaccharide/colanic/teichoic acid biosynthesis glycosyltransferase